MQINARIFKQARDRYNDEWKLLDDTLYKFCSEHPGHNKKSEVNTKVLLIGRGLASGIERQIKSKGTQGSSLEKLAGTLFRNARKIDSSFRRLPRGSERLDERTLHTIVDAHEKFCGILKECCRNKNNPSFASKYMHFHCPLVPVYDQVARSGLSNVLKNRGRTRGNPYAIYANHVLEILEAATRLSLNPTVRLCDQYLLWEGRKRAQVRRKK